VLALKYFSLRSKSDKNETSCDLLSDDSVRNLPNIMVQVVVVVVFSTVLAFFVNAVRKEGLSLVAPFPPEYRCPSRISEGRAVPTEEALRLYGQEGTVFVDARAKGSYDQGHIRDAVNIPYSFLDAVPPEAIIRLRRYKRIIVYCNAEGSERSRLMAGELSEAGLKEVSYLETGFLGWVKAGGRYTGLEPPGYE